MIYPDTSFLIAFYTLEKGTPDAKAHVAQARDFFVYTPFHRLETRTALRLWVFRGHLNREQLRRTFSKIDEDVASGFLQHTPLDWNEVLREAEAVAQDHLEKVGARTGDLLHVANALVLGASEFCTFDLRQAELAKRVGLKVKTWRPSR